jgi:hypothetical protein
MNRVLSRPIFPLPALALATAILTPPQPARSTEGSSDSASAQTYILDSPVLEALLAPISDLIPSPYNASEVAENPLEITISLAFTPAAMQTDLAREDAATVAPLRLQTLDVAPQTASPNLNTELPGFTDMHSVAIVTESSDSRDSPTFMTSLAMTTR